MPFAPHEIENKRFVVALRGYQTEEVEAFLRAVAADYRALLDQESGNAQAGELVAEIERVMRTARDDAEREVAELRAAAMRDAASVRANAEADASAIRNAAERDAAQLREATESEAEACFEEITRQAEQLRSLEAALWHRMHALEHTVMEARQTLAHVSDSYPMPAAAASGRSSGASEPLYRESAGLETNAAEATAAR
jgi:DivIVA domain-containing protein